MIDTERKLDRSAPAAGGPTEKLFEAGIWPGIDCISDGQCWVGERSADELNYVFRAFDPVSGSRGKEVRC